MTQDSSHGTFAWNIIKRLATERQAQNAALSEPEAIVKVVETSQGQFWYTMMKRAIRAGEPIEFTPLRPVAKREETSPKAQAWQIIQKAAQAIRAKYPHLTAADAVVKAVEEDPELYRRYRAAR
jgi:hypothetical protein